MHTIYSILLVLEVFLALFGAWCILNEDRLIAFEDRLSRKIKAAVRLRAKKAAAEKRRRINARVRYTPVPAEGIGKKADTREAA